jgi:hypothetical protein
MAATDDPGSSIDGLAEMLTVPEAARVLRIGRTLAYQLASRFLDGEPDGIPVIRLGGCLRVPRQALTELMQIGRVATRADLEAAVAATIDAQLHQPSVRPTQTTQSSRRRLARRGTAQLSLLDGR